jgi:hypothetical protein
MANEHSGAGNLPAAGWYPDTGNPDRERLWTGERWLNRVRPLRAGRAEEFPAGWYDDSGHPGFQRLWSGDMWTEEIRRAPAAEAVPVVTPVAVGAVAAAVPAVQTVPPSFHPGQWTLEPEPGPSMTYHDTRAPDRLRGLGTWVKLAFAATIAASVAQLVADQRYISMENGIIDGGTPSLDHIRSTAHAVHATNSITLIVEGITAILFIAWFYRAYCNLVRVGIADLRFGPGWAVGGWFIPLFNLFRQKQIANDIWKASAASRTVGLARRDEIPLSGVLNWWWATWIASGILIGVGGTRVAHANSGVDYSYSSLHIERSGLWWTQAGLVVAIVSAVLAFLFVAAVSRLQDEGFGG